MSTSVDTTKPAEVTIAGTTYQLGWSYNAIADMEKETGFTFDELVNRSERGSVYAVRALFAGALKKFQPDISVADAGELMERAGGPERLAELLTAATAPPGAPAAVGARKRAPRAAKGQAQ